MWLQTLRLRKNGFVSLSTTDDNGVAPGSFKTVPFPLPACAAAEQVLQLNIFTSIGAGTRAELLSADGATVYARSERIEGGGVHHNVSWMIKNQKPPQKVWIDAGCAYAAPGGLKCGVGQSFQDCTKRRDCAVHDGLDPPPGTRPGTWQDHN